ncbi:unnamed protein product [Tilletia controversa]|nr:unnamed protein product [Tilletia controversa]CAD6943087.1 unnamed protein product [Tilletia controversa]
MLSIQQSHFQSFSLLKAALQVADASPNSSSSNRSPADRPIVVVCVPIFRAPTLVQPPSPARALPLPPPGPSSDIVQPVRINDQFDCLAVPNVTVPLAAITLFNDLISGWPAAFNVPSQQTNNTDRGRNVKTVRQFREAAVGLSTLLRYLLVVSTVQS